MIRERQVKGPIQTIEHNGKTYRLEYRRRYYERATHFTWIEIEVAPHNWTETDAIQTGLLKRLTAKDARQLAIETIERL